MDESKEKVSEQVIDPTYQPPAPFSNRLKPKKYTAQMEIFKQVKVNVPFLDVIEQVSFYAKFLKD